MIPPAILYCSRQDVEWLLSTVAVELRLDDDDSGTVSQVELDAFLNQGLIWATSRCNYYLISKYKPEDLVTSPLVNEWATIAACWWLCSRRLNPIPETMTRLAYGRPGTDERGAMGDMVDVREDRTDIADIGQRDVEWPAWSNVRVDPRYRLKQIRVERPIS